MSGDKTFGSRNPPFDITMGQHVLGMTSDGDTLRYERTWEGGSVSRELVGSIDEVVINPIEPVTLPKPVTNYLMVVLPTPAVIAPKGNTTLLTTFPVDIGVQVRSGSHWRLIDSFSLLAPRYTLYGDPANGVVCRHWKGTDISGGDDDTVESEEDFHLKEGTLILEVANTSGKFVQLERVVLSSHGMHIYHDGRNATMQALCRIQKGANAQTSCIDDPPGSDMERAIDVYHSSVMNKDLEVFVMEWGL